MRIRFLLPLSFGALLVAACDRPPESVSAATSDAPADAAPASARLTRADVGECAGLDIESAAGLLGVPASALTAKTGWSDEMGGQTCRYWSSESLIGPGVQILFYIEDSEEAAIASLDSLRANAPGGSAAIAGAMGQAPPDAALVELEGAGDDALWDALTGTVNVRVGNVVATVEAAPSAELVQGQDRSEMELERRIAAAIGQGLAKH